MIFLIWLFGFQEDYLFHHSTKSIHLTTYASYYYFLSLKYSMSPFLWKIILSSKPISSKVLQDFQAYWLLNSFWKSFFGSFSLEHPNSFLEYFPISFFLPFISPITNSQFNSWTSIAHACLAYRKHDNPSSEAAINKKTINITNYNKEKNSKF